jgi:hypothetical protein
MDEHSNVLGCESVDMLIPHRISMATVCQFKQTMNLVVGAVSLSNPPWPGCKSPTAVVCVLQQQQRAEGHGMAWYATHPPQGGVMVWYAEGHGMVCYQAPSGWGHGMVC